MKAQQYLDSQERKDTGQTTPQRFENQTPAQEAVVYHNRACDSGTGTVELSLTILAAEKETIVEI